MTMLVGFAPSRAARTQRRRLVAVLAFDGVVLSDLATPCDVFGRVRDSKGNRQYEVRVCGCRRRIASEHLGFEVPWSLTTLRRADTIVVPGIDPIDRPVPEELMRGLRRAIARGARVASICTGAFVLARTGALNGLKATTHWLAAEELARHYPEIEVNPDVLYVDNGKILTSAGAAAGLDLCLHLVRRDLGAEVASCTARLAVMPLERAGGQAQFIIHDAPAVDDQDRDGNAITLDRKEPPQRAVAARDCQPGGHESENSEPAICRASGRNAGELGCCRACPPSTAAPGNNAFVR